MEIDLKHLAKCLRNDGSPDITYIVQHFEETPGWGCLAAEVLRLTARIAQLEAVVKAGDGLAEALEAVRPKAHAKMCPNPENPWARCMCGCDQPALTNYRAAKEAANG